MAPQRSLGCSRRAVPPPCAHARARRHVERRGAVQSRSTVLLSISGQARVRDSTMRVILLRSFLFLGGGSTGGVSLGAGCQSCHSNRNENGGQRRQGVAGRLHRVLWLTVCRRRTCRLLARSVCSNGSFCTQCRDRFLCRSLLPIRSRKLRWILWWR